MSKKHPKTTTPDTSPLDTLAAPKEPTDAPVKTSTAGADGPDKIDAPPQAPQGEPPDDKGGKAPESLSVTSANVTDMRVATLAQKLATGKADALGVVVCLYLSVAEGILAQIDRAHVETWSTHSGFSDLSRHAMWDGLVSSGWLVKDRADKGKWKLADFAATRQVEQPDA